MLKRENLHANFVPVSDKEIYYYATCQDNTAKLEQYIANSPANQAERNLETIMHYNHVYCESNSNLVSQLGKESYEWAKYFSWNGFKAAGLGIGISAGCDGSIPVCALALTMGTVGGAAIGALAGIAHALYARNQDMFPQNIEEKERVFTLKKIAENRVRFFNHPADLHQQNKIDHTKVSTAASNADFYHEPSLKPI